MNKIASLEDLFQFGRRGQPAGLRVSGKGTEQERFQMIKGLSPKAGVAGIISLRQMLPQLPGSSGDLYSVPRGTEVTLQAAIMNNSLASQFGAAIIVIDQAPAPEVNPVAGTYTRAGGFTVINPAVFQSADDTNPATEQPLPFVSAEILMDNFSSQAFRSKISRREQKDLRDNELSARIMAAVTLGLANLADRVLFDAIDAQVSQAAVAADLYSIGKAAAKNVRFKELRAVVAAGDAGGNSPIVDPLAALTVDAGGLRYQSIPAEISGQAPATFIGTFNRAAVALMDDVRIIVERGTAGELTITCWADIQPLLPDPNYFWRA